MNWLNHVKKGVLFSWIFMAAYPTQSRAWDKHQFLMPEVLNTQSASLTPILNRTFPAPCEAGDRNAYQALIEQLHLNPKSAVPPTVKQNCKPGAPLSVAEILGGSVVDDPDQGMDRDLPVDAGNTYDPNGDRKWMGGTEGPNSQGFRHMYFGGWKLSHPLTTFQIPLKAIGQAPQRTLLIAQKGKEWIKSGNGAWGTRVIGWAMHYIQDLSQPFHAVQLVNLRLVPWYELLSWPPGPAFEELRKQTTRVVTNFHWAYEGYVRDWVVQGEKSPFKDCLSQPEKYSQLKFDPKTQSPEDLARAVARASIELAPTVGSSEIDFLGGQLLEPGFDMTKTPEAVKNSDYAIRPDLADPRQRLHEVTCKALANGSLATRYLLQWAFEP